VEDNNDSDEAEYVDEAYVDTSSLRYLTASVWEYNYAWFATMSARETLKSSWQNLVNFW